MSSPHQSLIDKIQQLPPQRMAEVEDFVDFLRSRVHEAKVFEGSDKKTSKRPRPPQVPEAKASSSAPLRGRFQGRVSSAVSIRDMDEAIAAEVAAAHRKTGKREA